MGKISLQGLTFKAYHGYYDEERQKGNTFRVDITVKTNFHLAALNDDLSKTVDYEQLYAIVKEYMEQPSKLLEHVVQQIVDRVLKEHESVVWVKVSLSKFDPPIGGDCKAAKITLKKRR